MGLQTLRLEGHIFRFQVSLVEQFSTRVGRWVLLRARTMLKSCDLILPKPGKNMLPFIVIWSGMICAQQRRSSYAHNCTWDFNTSISGLHHHTRALEMCVSCLVARAARSRTRPDYRRLNASGPLLLSEFMWVGIIKAKAASGIGPIQAWALVSLASTGFRASGLEYQV